MATVLIPYEEFPADLDRLPAVTQEALRQVIEALWKNPYDPELIRKCECGPQERYACPLAGGYIFHWKIDCDSDVLSALPSKLVPIRVLMTAIRKIRL